MRYYEAMFLLVSSEASKDWEALEGRVRQILTKNEARIIDCKKWDEKRLAYSIGKHKRGIYLLTHFEASPESIDKIKRDASLSDDIIRLLILRDEKLEKELKTKEEKQIETKEEKKLEEVSTPSASSSGEEGRRDEEEKKSSGNEQGGDGG